MSSLRANRSVCPEKRHCINWFDCPMMQDATLVYRRMAEQPSCDEYWGLGKARYDERYSGDMNRDFAQSDILTTGYDADVIDGVMSPLSPGEEHLFQPRDHFKDNPYFEVVEGKSTADSLYVYTLEELLLTPEEAEAARPFIETAETRKPPWYTTRANYEDRSRCPMWEKAPLAHSRKPKGERRHDMWSLFHTLKWDHDKGEKVLDETGKPVYKSGKQVYRERKPRDDGWLYLGTVTVTMLMNQQTLRWDAVLEDWVPDEDKKRQEERLKFFITLRNGEFGIDIPKFPSQTVRRYSNRCADGVLKWMELLQDRDWNFKHDRTLTRADYEAQWKEIRARKAKAQVQTVTVGTMTPPDAICQTAMKSGKTCTRTKPCRYHG